MLRISNLHRDDGSDLLKLEGRLVGPWVELLRDTCSAYGTGQSPLALDLGEVIFASKEGLELLDHLAANGITCIAVSPILREMFPAASYPPACSDRIVGTFSPSWLISRLTVFPPRTLENS